jgi:hypothetical protein
MNKQATLPALKDIYSDKLEIKKNQELNMILNADPKKEWVKEHPIISGYKYIPVERQEYLMTMIYGKWTVEVKNVQLIANSVTVTVRVHYLDPVTGQMEWIDGVGASPIQTDKDAGATDFNKMKASAIQMSAPSAKTYAFKDAVETLGKIFGKDLNRKDMISYGFLENTIKDLTPDIEKTVDTINACRTKESLNAIWANIPPALKINEDVILAKDNKLADFTE